jgi:hypothetical protein
MKQQQYEIWLKINDRLPLHVRLQTSMLRVDEVTALEKRVLYKQAGVDKVPYLEMVVVDSGATMITQNVPREVTPRLCIGPTHKSYYYELYDDYLMAWLLDAKVQSADDDMRRVLYDKVGEKYVKQQTGFVYVKMGEFDTILGYMEHVDGLWRKLRNARLIGSEFLAKYNHLNGGSLHLMVDLTRWAPYVKRVLYQSEQSLLYDSEQWARNVPYEVVPVEIEPSGRPRDKAYWVALLKRYREENPDEAWDVTASHLMDRPHDFDLLRERAVAFVALDRRERGRHDRAVGYVVCSLRALHSFAAQHEPPFQSDALNLLNDHLQSNNERYMDEPGDRPSQRLSAGLDVFSIDGIHVHQRHRGEKTATPISKILVFHALEFIRVAAKELGVVAVMSGAEANGTKAILVNTFGFKHYNCVNDTLWLQRYMNDFYTQRVEIDATASRPAATTPPHLLTRAALEKNVKDFMRKYDLVGRAADMGGMTQALQTLLDSLATSMAAQAADTPLSPGAASTWPAEFMTPDEFNQLRIDLNFEPVEAPTKKKKKKKKKKGKEAEEEPPPKMPYIHYVRQNAELGVRYLERVRSLLHTGDDNQDCFIFLGPPARVSEEEEDVSTTTASSTADVVAAGGPNPDFESNMAKFYELYRLNRPVRETDWVDDDVTWRDIATTSSEDLQRGAGHDDSDMDVESTTTASSTVVSKRVTYVEPDDDDLYRLMSAGADDDGEDNDTEPTEKDMALLALWIAAVEGEQAVVEENVPITEKSTKSTKKTKPENAEKPMPPPPRNVKPRTEEAPTPREKQQKATPQHHGKKRTPPSLPQPLQPLNPLQPGPPPQKQRQPQQGGDVIHPPQQQGGRRILAGAGRPRGRATARPETQEYRPRVANSFRPGRPPKEVKQTPQPPLVRNLLYPQQQQPQVMITPQYLQSIKDQYHAQRQQHEQQYDIYAAQWMPATVESAKAQLPGLSEDKYQAMARDYVANQLSVQMNYRRDYVTYRQWIAAQHPELLLYIDEL